MYLNLKVKYFPQLVDQIVSVCQDDFPISISSGIDGSLMNDFKYNWNSWCAFGSYCLLSIAEWLYYI